MSKVRTVNEVFAELSRNFECPICGGKGVSRLYKDWDNNIICCSLCIYGEPTSEYLMGQAMDIVAEEKMKRRNVK